MTFRRMKASVLGAIVLLVFDGAQAQQSGIDSKKAEEYFAEAEAICARDAGELWGVSLCGPMMFADRAMRMVAANQADKEGRLKKDGAVYVGRLTPEINISNTAVEWAGVKWTMVMWPLSQNPVGRARLMMHEQFHRVQDGIGLPALSPANAHLDSVEGRVWMQLEWRALREALLGEGEGKEAAAADALLFRAVRQWGNATAAREERALEMNEGMAEYTGVKLRGTGDEETRKYMAQRLKDAEKQESFSRSFAYEMGPAYGLLLDATGTRWRAGLTSETDLGGLLAKAMEIELDGDLRAITQQRVGRYDGAALRAAEEERAKERARAIGELRAKFVDGPVLVMQPGAKFSFSFDPYGAVTLEGVGTVYRELRVTDEWGALEVTKGALLRRNEIGFTGVVVAAPGEVVGRVIQGDGWKLELAEGWEIAKGERKGDFVVKKWP